MKNKNSKKKYKEMGVNLVDQRKKLGYNTAEKLAEVSGFKVSTIQNYESGARAISRKSQSMLEKLGLDVDTLRNLIMEAEGDSSVFRPNKSVDEAVFRATKRLRVSEAQEIYVSKEEEKLLEAFRKCGSELQEVILQQAKMLSKTEKKSYKGADKTDSVLLEVLENMDFKEKLLKTKDGMVIKITKEGG